MKGHGKDVVVVRHHFWRSEVCLVFIIRISVQESLYPFQTIFLFSLRELQALLRS
jgi:hypothetical protein